MLEGGAASQSGVDKTMVKHKLCGQRLSPAAGKKLLVPLQAVSSKSLGCSSYGKDLS